MGGWLVLERWITQSLFNGLLATDETGFCIECGDSKNEKLRKHRKSFITEADFEWLAGRGINAVRIPVSHWLFGNLEPYVGADDTLDQAFEWAAKNNLKVILDIHTAPGSQNGWDHSGKAGKITWHKSNQNIETSINFVTRLAERYKDAISLWGIELLNEPDGRIPEKILKEYYLKSYVEIRKICGDGVRVIISDSFKPFVWHDFMAGDEYKNTVLDSHMYQCFRRRDKRLNLQGHLSKAKAEWRQQIDKVSRQTPVIVGEWSLGLDPSTLKNMEQKDRNAALREYANAQLMAFANAEGWFFWTYKTENEGGWNFRHCVETGLLPQKF